MNDVFDVFSQGVDWTFLQEPLWRWAVFFVAASGFLYVWHGVIALMH
jgi:hypothetical protein